ncbi:protein FAM200C-like [Palaemon carinicauda]|uniref:protein FAM200C-like n=1 Tax=Palaemon carinicauda TaxID=392227 RepID=UPI0035B64786
MSAKKRKYNEDYIRFGFVSLRKGDTEVPQCVICYKTLSNDGMRPSRLERYLQTAHPGLVDKPKAFFETKKHTLKQVKMDDSGVFRQQSSKVVEASYEISMLIAKSKKSHNIGETLIKPSILCAAQLILGKDSANKLSQISLSNDTVQRRIHELSQDIKEQTLELVRASPVFAIQCDEMTDIAQCAQFLMYARFVSGNNIKEEILFCCPMESSSRTLPDEMRDVLNVAIKVVNFIKSGALNSRLFKLLCKDMDSEHEALLFHTNIRWLSKGNMLERLYELREEAIIFLDSQQKAALHDKFKSDSFQIILAYLVDIFESLNAVNLKLQGKNIHIISHHDTIRTFMAKLDLWKCRIQQGNAASFRNLDSGLAHGNLDPELKILIITHLSSLKAEFTKYFPDIDDMRESWKFIRNPFQCEFANVAEEIQEEFLELKFNSTAKDEFNDFDLETFWIKYHSVYPLISHQALRVLTMFGSTYLCETAFSTLTAIKTKYRNRLDVEDDLLEITDENILQNAASIVTSSSKFARCTSCLAGQCQIYHIETKRLLTMEYMAQAKKGESHLKLSSRIAAEMEDFMDGHDPLEGIKDPWLRKMMKSQLPAYPLGILYQSIPIERAIENMRTLMSGVPKEWDEEESRPGGNNQKENAYPTSLPLSQSAGNRLSTEKRHPGHGAKNRPQPQSGLQCFNCGKWGHYARNCRSA